MDASITMQKISLYKVLTKLKNTVYFQFSVFSFILRISATPRAQCLCYPYAVLCTAAAAVVYFCSGNAPAVISVTVTAIVVEVEVAHALWQLLIAVVLSCSLCSCY